MSILSDTNSSWSIRTGSTTPDNCQNRDQDFENNLPATGIVPPPNKLDKNTSPKLLNVSTAQTQPLLPPRQKQPLPAPCSRKMSVPTTPPSTEDTSPSNKFDEKTSPKLLNDVVPLLPPRQKQTLPAPCNRKMSAPTLSKFSAFSTNSSFSKPDMTSSHQEILDENTAFKLLVDASPQKQPNLPHRPIPKRVRKTSASPLDTPSSQSDLLHATIINYQMPPRTNENIYEPCTVPSRQAPPVPKSASSCPQLGPPPHSLEMNDGYLQPKIPLPLPVQENVVTNRQISSQTKHSTSESSNRSYRRPHCILRRRNLIIISFISFLLSCVSMSVLVLLVIKPFTNSWQSRSFREGEFSACVKCVYLVQYATDNNTDLRSLDNENRAGGMFCCARRSEEISKLMKLILRQPDYEPKTQIGIPQDVTPHAHKKMGYATININNQCNFAVPKGHSIMKVSQENSSIFYNQSVLVSDYSLEIQVSGWYYVYSNIYYMTNCGKETNYTVFEHTVGRLSLNHPVKGGSLAKTEYTCCSECTPQDHKSSFTGGVFELFQGDQIFASVTNINVVNFDESPYLGAVMIGEEF